MRYATVRVTPLNAGTGEAIRNFETQEEFEVWYRKMFPKFEVPQRGVGAVGDAIFSFSWKIYPEPKWVEVFSNFANSIQTRLIAYKIRKRALYSGARA